MKHNTAIQRNHFRKQWQLRVKTWFNQPAKKLKRRQAREKKAAAVFPRPVGLLRPVVQAPTKRYNTKARFGRGFSVEELKRAGLSVSQALTIGIAVDRRRKNRSEESLARNAARLGQYKSKLILFPRVAGKPKKGSFVSDAKEEDLKNVTQHTGTLLPITTAAEHVEYRAITPEEKNSSAFATLRRARDWVKKVGTRQKLKEKNAEKRKAAPAEKAAE